MIQIVRKFPDKVLLGVAVAMLAVSCGWVWRQQAAVRRLRAQPVMVRLAGSQYQAVDRQVSDAMTAVWPPPAAQSHGSGWLFEVFTPPVVYYDPAARTFAVMASLRHDDVAAPFGLELIGVKLAPYRLQLAGYFGGPGDYLAAFTSPELPETLLAREGVRLEKLGLTLKSFAVKPVVVSSNDAGPVYDRAALAVMRDERTGAEVELDSRTRKLTDQPLAVCRLLTGESRLCELAEGDQVSDGVSTYRIGHIQLDPPEVVVARQVPGAPLPECEILRPVRNYPRPKSGQSAKSARTPLHRPTGLTASDN